MNYLAPVLSALLQWRVVVATVANGAATAL
jgi:hypothetical protein